MKQQESLRLSEFIYEDVKKEISSLTTHKDLLNERGIGYLDALSYMEEMIRNKSGRTEEEKVENLLQSITKFDILYTTDEEKWLEQYNRWKEMRERVKRYLDE